MSKTGFGLAGVFILVGAYFILTQGLFGESFIALVLGLPWLLIPAYFEFFGIENSTAMMVFTLVPIGINILLLYGIGFLLGSLFTRKNATM